MFFMFCRKLFTYLPKNNKMQNWYNINNNKFLAQFPFSKFQRKIFKFFNGNHFRKLRNLIFFYLGNYVFLNGIREF